MGALVRRFQHKNTGRHAHQITCCAAFCVACFECRKETVLPPPPRVSFQRQQRQQAAAGIQWRLMPPRLYLLPRHFARLSFRCHPPTHPPTPRILMLAARYYNCRCPQSRRPTPAVTCRRPMTQNTTSQPLRASPAPSCITWCSSPAPTAARAASQLPRSWRASPLTALMGVRALHSEGASL